MYRNYNEVGCVKVALLVLCLVEDFWTMDRNGTRWQPYPVANHISSYTYLIFYYMYFLYKSEAFWDWMLYRIMLYKPLFSLDKKKTFFYQIWIKVDGMYGKKVVDFIKCMVKINWDSHHKHDMHTLFSNTILLWLSKCYSNCLQWCISQVNK